MPRIVLATQNDGKVRELRSLTRGTGLDFLELEFVGLGELGEGYEETVENGDSFLANATIKAVAYARATGMHCLADDSGLEVDALGGRPGVISSHYAFEGQTEGTAAGMGRAERDAANNARLLADLKDVAEEQRGARFVCTMVLASPEGEVLATSSGAFEGRIGREGPGKNRVPRGEQGFGYDPLFLVGPEFERTSAELSAAEKNRLSHRGQAVAGMLAQLDGIFRKD